MASRHTVIPIDLSTGAVENREIRVDYRRIYAIEVPAPLRIRIDSPGGPEIPVPRPGKVWEDCGQVVEKIYVSHGGGSGIVRLLCADDIDVDPSGAGGESSGQLIVSISPTLFSASVVNAAAAAGGNVVNSETSGNTGFATERHATFGVGWRVSCPAGVTANSRASSIWGHNATNRAPHVDVANVLAHPYRPEVSDWWREWRSTFAAEFTVVSVGAEIRANFALGISLAPTSGSGPPERPVVGFEARRGGNWRAVIYPGSGGAALVDVDLSVDSSTPRALALRVGREGGQGYVEWRIRGVPVHRVAPSSALNLGSFVAYGFGYPIFGVLRESGASDDAVSLRWGGEGGVTLYGAGP